MKTPSKRRFDTSLYNFNLDGVIATEAPTSPVVTYATRIRFDEIYKGSKLEIEIGNWGNWGQNWGQVWS